MKFERTKNTSRNIFFGSILKVYQIICPFIIRTAMIYSLGMEYVGLNSLFASILQVLNLTELGVGTAMVYSMYKPIAEDDQVKIAQLMNLYKEYYKIIGFIIAVVGLAITPIVPRLIASNSKVPLNIYVLYWINLGYTVISYWLFAYKSSALIAHQRNDIISKIMLVTNTIMYILQLATIVFIKNYYAYLLVLPFGQAINNIVTAIIVDKIYPEYKKGGKIDKNEQRQINGRIMDLFTSKIGGVIQNSVDSIVISAFLGLTILAKYNNYYYIMNSIFGFLIVIFNSCLAGIGNSLVTETPEKNYKDLKKIVFLTEWLAGFCVCCLFSLYQPFMKIWVGDSNLLPIGVVCCICIYTYILITNQMLCLYKDASGIWHADRYRPLITAMINLVLNLLLVNFWGLYGVVLSTVISMLFVGMPWLIHNIFSEVFHRKSTFFVYDIISYALIWIGISFLNFLICGLIQDNGILTFLLKIVICTIIPNTIYFLIYKDRRIFKEAMCLVNKMTNNRLNKIPVIKKII